jgi:membrane protein required for colicin V production
MEQQTATVVTATLMGLNWTDYAIIGVILVSTLISLMRGFVREALSLVTWGVAIWIGIRFSGQLSDLLARYISTPSLRLIASFGVLFVLALILGSLVNFLLSELISRTGLSGTDRLLGMLFGVARGVLLVSIMLLLAGMTTFSQDDWWKSSIFIPHFQPIVDWLHTFLPQKVTQLSALVHV